MHVSLQSTDQSKAQREVNGNGASATRPHSGGFSYVRNVMDSDNDNMLENMPNVKYMEENLSSEDQESKSKETAVKEGAQNYEESVTVSPNKNVNETMEEGSESESISIHVCHNMLQSSNWSDSSEAREDGDNENQESGQIASVDVIEELQCSVDRPKDLETSRTCANKTEDHPLPSNSVGAHIGIAVLNDIEEDQATTLQETADLLQNRVPVHDAKDSRESLNDSFNETTEPSGTQRGTDSADLSHEMLESYWSDIIETGTDEDKGNKEAEKATVEKEIEFLRCRTKDEWSATLGIDETEEPLFPGDKNLTITMEQICKTTEEATQIGQHDNVRKESKQGVQVVLSAQPKVTFGSGIEKTDLGGFGKQRNENIQAEHFVCEKAGERDSSMPVRLAFAEGTLNEFEKNKCEDVPTRSENAALKYPEHKQHNDAQRSTTETSNHCPVPMHGSPEIVGRSSAKITENACVIKTDDNENPTSYEQFRNDMPGDPENRESHDTNISEVQNKDPDGDEDHSDRRVVVAEDSRNAPNPIGFTIDHSKQSHGDARCTFKLVGVDDMDHRKHHQNANEHSLVFVENDLLEDSRNAAISSIRNIKDDSNEDSLDESAINRTTVDLTRDTRKGSQDEEQGTIRSGDIDYLGDSNHKEFATGEILVDYRNELSQGSGDPPINDIPEESSDAENDSIRSENNDRGDIDDDDCDSEDSLVDYRNDTSEASREEDNSSIDSEENNKREGVNDEPEIKDDYKSTTSRECDMSDKIFTIASEWLRWEEVAVEEECEHEDSLPFDFRNDLLDAPKASTKHNDSSEKDYSKKMDARETCPSDFRADLSSNHSHGYDNETFIIGTVKVKQRNRHDHQENIAGDIQDHLKMDSDSGSEMGNSSIMPEKDHCSEKVSDQDEKVHSTADLGEKGNAGQHSSTNSEVGDGREEVKDQEYDNGPSFAGFKNEDPTANQNPSIVSEEDTHKKFGDQGYRNQDSSNYHRSETSQDFNEEEYCCISSEKENGKSESEKCSVEARNDFLDDSNDCKDSPIKSERDKKDTDGDKCESDEAYGALGCLSNEELDDSSEGANFNISDKEDHNENYGEQLHDVRNSPTYFRSDDSSSENSYTMNEDSNSNTFDNPEGESKNASGNLRNEDSSTDIIRLVSHENDHRKNFGQQEKRAEGYSVYNRNDLSDDSSSSESSSMMFKEEETKSVDSEGSENENRSCKLLENSSTRPEGEKPQMGTPVSFVNSTSKDVTQDGGIKSEVGNSNTLGDQESDGDDSHTDDENSRNGSEDGAKENNDNQEYDSGSSSIDFKNAVSGDSNEMENLSSDEASSEKEEHRGDVANQEFDNENSSEEEGDDGKTLKSDQDKLEQNIKRHSPVYFRNDLSEDCSNSENSSIMSEEEERNIVDDQEHRNEEFPVDYRNDMSNAAENAASQTEKDEGNKNVENQDDDSGDYPVDFRNDDSDDSSDDTTVSHEKVKVEQEITDSAVDFRNDVSEDSCDNESHSSRSEQDHNKEMGDNQENRRDDSSVDFRNNFSGNSHDDESYSNRSEQDYTKEKGDDQEGRSDDSSVEFRNDFSGNSRGDESYSSRSEQDHNRENGNEQEDSNDDSSVDFRNDFSGNSRDDESYSSRSEQDCNKEKEDDQDDRSDDSSVEFRNDFSGNSCGDESYSSRSEQDYNMENGNDQEDTNDDSSVDFRNDFSGNSSDDESYSSRSEQDYNRENGNEQEDSNDGSSVDFRNEAFENSKDDQRSLMDEIDDQTYETDNSSINYRNNASTDSESDHRKIYNGTSENSCITIKDISSHSRVSKFEDRVRRENKEYSSSSDEEKDIAESFNDKKRQQVPCMKNKATAKKRIGTSRVTEDVMRRNEDSSYEEFNSKRSKVRSRIGKEGSRSRTWKLKPPQEGKESRSVQVAIRFHPCGHALILESKKLSMYFFRCCLGIVAISSVLCFVLF